MTWPRVLAFVISGVTTLMINPSFLSTVPRAGNVIMKFVFFLVFWFVLAKILARMQRTKN